MVSIRDRAYIFGGVHGVLGAQKDVLIMDAQFNWKKFFQSLNKGRMGFRSVVYSDDKVTFLGKH